MKPTQPAKGTSEKKPNEKMTPLSAPAAGDGGAVSPRPAFGVPPSEAVWSRYIDSRMKHFGTR